MVYLAGIGISVGYIAKPDLKRTLITSGAMVAITVVTLISLFVFNKGYDGQVAFLAICTGFLIYLLLISLAVLGVGISTRSGIWIGAGCTGVIVCSLVFLVLKSIWDASF
ncbi:hypothetical protein [Polluticoccus soli]|uniref:hypothetical protein n=1 Tax=Polluticoccus soli TaxID=3034150 RepID=UPI0023E20222|nr:hypothetical protein [Flavipsychrobacter sp. JY13-12]